jgi:STE24 endopeptidase
MQFIVFAAFAVVLSIPDKGVPWKSELIHSRSLTAAIMVGQVVAAGLIGLVGTWLVRRKLENNPAWLPAAQRRLSQVNSLLRFFLISSFSTSLYSTNWSQMVRGTSWIQRVWGLDELVMLLPFLLAVMASWAALYPADRGIRQVSFEMRLWASQPGRPVWGLASYMMFMFRHHVLIILATMIPIVVAIDAVSPEHYGRWLRVRTQVVWADQAVLVVVAGLVFLVAPLCLRFIWQTMPLPAGELRDRLDALCRRVRLRYRDILIWQSDGMVVNAAVMGLVRPVRYILLSDGLLETMDDRQIEAVFGHEAGHVKHHHITFYLLFAILSMLVVGGISELVSRYTPRLLGTPAQTRDYLQVLAMVMIVAVWGFTFGPVSRRFEWQADLFGALSLTPSVTECMQPCLVHAPSGSPAPAGSVRLCATAAQVFGSALEQIATLNGIPLEARSWRHSSIGNRVRLLQRYAAQPQAIRDLGRAVVAIKILLVVGTTIGLAIGTWLYWPASLVRNLAALIRS